MNDIDILKPIDHNTLKNNFSFDDMKSYYLERFIKMFPTYLKLMEETQHGYNIDHPNQYHLEGSVWTHTMMVYKAMDNFNVLPNEINLTKYINAYTVDNVYFYNTVSILIALFHDIGKCFTKKEHKSKKYKCVFYDHAISSETICKSILPKFLETETNINIFDTQKCIDITSHVVSNHMKLYDVNKIEKLSKYTRNNFYVSILMYNFKNADKKGQIRSINERCDNKSDLDKLFSEFLSTVDLEF